MRVIVAAAGNQSRWGNHLGVPKHLVPVDGGEPLLHRTVRQLAGHDIIVVGPGDARYRIPGSRLVVPNDMSRWAGPLNYERKWRDPAGRTLLLLGDVYFSDAGMATILGYEVREWRLFCRFEGSQMTGGRWGEVWGHSFWPEHWARHEDRMRYVFDLQRRGVIRRNGLWEHYRAMSGAKDKDVAEHRDLGSATVIDDWTEDWDFGEDYDRWLARRLDAGV